MADIQEIARQFTQFYYQTFDNQRQNLAGLYRPTSMLTWEQKQFQGAQAIVEHLSVRHGTLKMRLKQNRLQSLPFGKVQHNISTLDAQPSSTTQASVLVLVTGQLVVDDGPNTLNYSQTFQLIPEGNSFYIFNDIFRLVYG